MDEAIRQTKLTLSISKTELDYYETKLAGLKEYKNYNLTTSRRKDGRCYYYKYKKGSFKKTYLGDKENPEVKAIKDVHQYETSIYKTKMTIRVLEKILSDLEQLIEEGETVYGLPKTYWKDLRESDPNYKGADSRVIEWLAAQNAFKLDFLSKHPEKYPESLRYQRYNGELMRSKSEISIADILELNKLPYIYELPHYCNGVWIKSDFTILSPRDYKTEIIIEHIGRLDLPEYQEQFNRKLKTYMDAGWIPNVNLFFTFDNLDGTFSQIPLQTIIDSFIMPRS